MRVDCKMEERRRGRAGEEVSVVEEEADATKEEEVSRSRRWRS